MKRLSVFAALLATPAIAHDGPHLHPHGLETSWAATLLVVATLAAVALFARNRR